METFTIVLFVLLGLVLFVGLAISNHARTEHFAAFWGGIGRVTHPGMLPREKQLQGTQRNFK